MIPSRSGKRTIPCLAHSYMASCLMRFEGREGLMLEVRSSWLFFVTLSANFYT